MSAGEKRTLDLLLISIGLNLVFLVDGLGIMPVPWWVVIPCFFGSCAVAIASLVYYFWPSTLPRD